MKEKILKGILISFLASPLYAGEFQIGSGTFEMNGGFLGLNQSIKTGLITYSLVEQHRNIGSSSWFYKYNVTWFDSEKMMQSQQSLNTFPGGFLQPPTNVTTPSIDYKLQGLDAGITLGKDVFHQDENNYVGLGVMLGISLPWIDSEKNNNNNDLLSDTNMNLMQDSKTEILTYKIGPSIVARKSLNSLFTLYGSATYAFQTGTFKNSYANASLSVNGIFQEYDIGIRFQPVSYDHDFGWITISPRLYATLGHRISSWKVNDVNIDVTGINTKFTQMDFSMKSTVTYMGLGYSF